MALPGRGKARKLLFLSAHGLEDELHLGRKDRRAKARNNLEALSTATPYETTPAPVELSYAKDHPGSTQARTGEGQTGGSSAPECRLA